MSIHIGFHDRPSPSQSFDLQRLNEQLQDADIVVETVDAPLEERVRDSGAVVGMAIASLVASSISTFVLVLAFWRSTNPKYSITVTNGDLSVTAGDLSPTVARETMKTLLSHSQTDDVAISIGSVDTE